MLDDDDDFITLAELKRRTGKTREFILALSLPVYRVRNRDYYTCRDYEIAIQNIKQKAASWQSKGANSRKDSNGSQGRRTSGSTSPTKVIGFEEAVKQSALNLQRNGLL